MFVSGFTSGMESYSPGWPGNKTVAQACLDLTILLSGSKALLYIDSYSLPRLRYFLPFGKKNFEKMMAASLSRVYLNKGASYIPDAAVVAGDTPENKTDEPCSHGEQRQ